VKVSDGLRRDMLNTKFFILRNTGYSGDYVQGDVTASISETPVQRQCLYKR
jgi:hypothetical protein